MTPKTKHELGRCLEDLHLPGANRGLEDWFCESLFEEGFMKHIVADVGGAVAFNEAAKKCGAEREDYGGVMESKQEEHLQRIKNKFLDDVDKRYRAGNKEHGGFILDKPGLIDEALEEIVDLYVYLVSVKEQIEGL